MIDRMPEPTPVPDQYAAGNYPNLLVRRAAARSEIVMLTLRAQQLPEPINDRRDEGDFYWWSERDYLLRRIDELRAVVDEPIPGPSLA